MKKTILNICNPFTDIEKFYSILISFNVTACGYGAIATVMEISKKWGQPKASC